MWRSFRKYPWKEGMKDVFLEKNILRYSITLILVYSSFIFEKIDSKLVHILGSNMGFLSPPGFSFSFFFLFFLLSFLFLFLFLKSLSLFLKFFSFFLKLLSYLRKSLKSSGTWTWNSRKPWFTTQTHYDFVHNILLSFHWVSQLVTFNNVITSLNPNQKPKRW